MELLVLLIRFSFWPIPAHLSATLHMFMSNSSCVIMTCTKLWKPLGSGSASITSCQSSVANETLVSDTELFKLSEMAKYERYRVVSQKPNRSKVGDSCITEVCTLGSKYGSVGAYLKQKVKEYTTMAD